MKNWRIQLKVGWRNELEERLAKYTVQKIVQARKQAGLSQRQLSERLGRSNAYISQIENGRIDLGVVDLIGIAWLLDKPIKYFLPDYQKADQEPLDGQEREALEQFRRISSIAKRDYAIKLIQQLADSRFADDATEEKPKRKR